MSEREESARRARRRALRAAKVVTLGLAIAGCSLSHEAGHDAGEPMAQVQTDAGRDGGLDSGLDAGFDAGFDAGAVADAGICDFEGDFEEYSRCCEANGWAFDLGCMAWGPYVPPGAQAAPSRAVSVHDVLA